MKAVEHCSAAFLIARFVGCIASWLLVDLATMLSMQVMVIGGGAAGYFAAITAAENGAQVVIAEAAKPLAKVRISGGGRCNVTTAVQDPRQLIQNYPRGQRELLGPFKHFGPRDTVAWFAARGVELKTESDGRLFPVTDDSATIVDCLQGAATDAGVILQRARVEAIEATAAGFALRTSAGAQSADRVILATGGGKAGHRLAESLGHQMISPVPSIFTASLREPWLTELSGVSVTDVSVQLKVGEQQWQHQGPLLVTHWGVSGPAFLRLSAFAARALAETNYHAEVIVNWVGADAAALRTAIATQRIQHGKALVSNWRLPEVAQRLSKALIQRAGIAANQQWAALTKGQTASLVEELTACRLAMTGKGVFKEEFVTAGGIARDQLNWKRMESRVCPGFHAAGEVIDVDGVTGGFNFQAAWTTGYLAGLAVASNYE